MTIENVRNAGSIGTYEGIPFYSSKRGLIRKGVTVYRITDEPIAYTSAFRVREVLYRKGLESYLLMSKVTRGLYDIFLVGKE